MKTEITSNSYENGKRISQQRVIYDKSDDLFMLANLQRQYETVTLQIEEALEEANTTYLRGEQTRLLLEIETQQILVDGYNVQ